MTKERYFQRIARRGRIVPRGIAIHFALPLEIDLLKEVENHFNVKIDEMSDNVSTVCHLN